MAFSENLQFIRAEHGVTQEQLAEQLGVSRQSVSKWEGGQSFPEMDTLLRICDLYAVNLDILLRGDLRESVVTDTAHYDSFMNSFAKRIALAVGGIIGGVALMMALVALGVPEMIAGGLFLLIVAVAVVVFIASGVEHDNFTKKHPYIADFYTEAEREHFNRRFVWYIAAPVGAILFGVVLLCLFFYVFPEEGAYELWAGAVFMFIISASVTVLVYGGIQKDKYDLEKYNREHNPTPESRERQEKAGIICGMIMVVATAVYVALGLWRNLWGTAWVVYPIAGILCAIPSMLLRPKA